MDGHFQHAKDAGAAIEFEPQDMPYGLRPHDEQTVVLILVAQAESVAEFMRCGASPVDLSTERARPAGSGPA